jgi:hypothetical protein
VVLKGPREQVPLAKDHLLTYLQKLATQVTETMQMAGDSMGSILGKGGANVRAIEEKHEVQFMRPHAHCECEMLAQRRVSASCIGDYQAA